MSEHRKGTNISESQLFGRINQFKRVFFVLITSAMALLSSANAFSAIRMEVVTERFSDDKLQTFEFEIFRDGEVSSSFIKSEGSRKLPNDGHLVSFNSGKDVYFLTPDNNECKHFKGGDFSRAMGSSMMKLIDRYDVTMSQPILKKTFEEDGKKILGFPVRETHWDLRFTITYPFMVKDLTWHVQRKFKLWQTESRNLPVAPLIIQPVFPKTGFDLLDSIVLKTLKESPGFPLRSEFEQVIDASVGSPPKLRLVQKVESIDPVKAFPVLDSFAAADCQRISNKQLEKEGKDIMWLLYGKPIK